MFYIFVYFSLCNIRDALTFKRVDDLVINQVENFVRGDLPEIILHWKKSEKGKLLKDTDYFGDIYASNPKSFKFVLGDLIQIKELVKHVTHKRWVAILFTTK